MAKSEVLVERLRRVGSDSKGLVDVEPVEASVTGCFGMPNKSSRRAFG